MRGNGIPDVKTSYESADRPLGKSQISTDVSIDGHRYDLAAARFTSITRWFSARLAIAETVRTGPNRASRESYNKDRCQAEVRRQVDKKSRD